LLKIKKAVELPEVLHGFDFNYKKRSAAESPPFEVPPPPIIQ
jgi:hypothetical protein